MKRVGVVDYVNALPLAHGLERELPDAEIVHTTPACIADALERDALDVGLVPVATLTGNPAWKVVPGLGIAGEGAVGSVLLLSRVPVPEIRRLVADPASRTSNLLALLWLQHVIDRIPEIVPGSEGPGERLDSGDATVVIGNDALFWSKPVPERVDLGEAWTAWTGLPFVFAVWAGPGAGDPELAAGLERCYSANEGRWAALAAVSAETDRRGLIESYLRDNIRYRLGSREQEGLSRFLDLVRARDRASVSGGDSHVHAH